MGENIFSKWLGKRITNESCENEENDYFESSTSINDFDKKLKIMDSSINQDSEEFIPEKVKENTTKNPNTTRLNDFDKKLKSLDSLIKEGMKNDNSNAIINGMSKDDYKKILIKNKIKHNANVKTFDSVNKLKYALNKYDDLNKDRKDYTSYSDSLNNEVDAKDVNTSIDNELNNILLEKLNVNNKKEKPLSEKQKKELQRQIEADKNRENDFHNKTEKLKSIIDDFDNKKKKENEEYITYKDRLVRNEEEDLDEGAKAKLYTFDTLLEKSGSKLRLK